jgi:hypothetical protein
LEQACRQLTESDAHRQISYTAVKHALAVVRAEQIERPRTRETVASAPGHDHAHPRRVTGRDTSGAHLAGPQAFSLDVLTGAQAGAEGANA